MLSVTKKLKIAGKMPELAAIDPLDAHCDLNRKRKK